jgi:ketosteroid isomerase-like protein
MQIALILPAAIVGVACVRGGADPADEILAELRAYAEAVETGDEAAALAFYSEDWSKDGKTKEDLTGVFAGGYFVGAFEDTGIGLDQAEIVVDGDTAIVAHTCLR